MKTKIISLSILSVLIIGIAIAGITMNKEIEIDRNLLSKSNPSTNYTYQEKTITINGITKEKICAYADGNSIGCAFTNQKNNAESILKSLIERDMNNKLKTLPEVNIIEEGTIILKEKK